MQTFLPYADFHETARVLDDRRLGKQRVEALQILNALGKTSGGWVNHPAVKMWRGFEPALVLYAFAMCDEWTRRGYRDSVRATLESRLDGALEPGSVSLPPWLGDAAFHVAHQSNLIRKDCGFYGERFPGVEAGLEYVWPVA